jgi:hypothetical protein
MTAVPVVPIFCMPAFGVISKKKIVGNYLNVVVFFWGNEGRVTTEAKFVFSPWTTKWT